MTRRHSAAPGRGVRLHPGAEKPSGARRRAWRDESRNPGTRATPHFWGQPVENRKQGIEQNLHTHIRSSVAHSGQEVETSHVSGQTPGGPSTQRGLPQPCRGGHSDAMQPGPSPSTRRSARHAGHEGTDPGGCSSGRCHRSQGWPLGMPGRGASEHSWGQGVTWEDENVRSGVDGGDGSTTCGWTQCHGTARLETLGTVNSVLRTFRHN